MGIFSHNEGRLFKGGDAIACAWFHQLLNCFLSKAFSMHLYQIIGFLYHRMAVPLVAPQAAPCQNASCTSSPKLHWVTALLRCSATRLLQFLRKHFAHVRQSTYASSTFPQDTCSKSAESSLLDVAGGCKSAVDDVDFVSGACSRSTIARSKSNDSSSSNSLSAIRSKVRSKNGDE